MEELSQEEILELELAADREAELLRTQRLLESDEAYQATLSRIQNDESLTSAQKQQQIEVLNAGATDKLKQKQSNPVKDYDYFYGDLKDESGEPIVQPEGQGLFGKIQAGFGDAMQFVGISDDPNTAQVERQEIQDQQAEFEAAAEAEKAKYPTTEVPWWAASEVDAMGEPISVYYEVDDNNEVKMTRIPTVDSNMISRAIDSGTRRIVTSVGGLVERDDDGNLEVNITEESDLEKSIPELESGGFEGFLTDMIAFGIPAAKGYKTFKTVAGAGSKLKPAARAYLGGSLGAAFAQAVVTTDGDSSLLVTGDNIKSVLPNIKEETANDVAMVVDSLVVDGVFDVALAGLMKGAGFLGRRGQGLRSALDKEYLTRTIKEGTILNTLTYLDPKLKDLGAKDFLQNVRQLAKVLNNNAEIHLKIGDVEGAVPVDTVNALMKGAKAYVTVTNQKLKNQMGDKFDDFVNEEATALVQRMIDIQRSVPENVQSRMAQSNMIDSTQQVLKDAGDDITPEGFTTQDAGQELVDLRRSDVETADFNTQTLAGEVDTLAAQTDAVFAENPVIKQMLDGVDPKELLDETTDLAVIQKVFGEDGVEAYRQTWKEVEAAYAAIPNTPLDKTQLKMLREEINKVITEIDPLRTEGKDNAKVSSLLSEIRAVFKPREIDVSAPNTSQFDSPEAAERYFSDTMPPEGGTTRLQTADEVLADLEGTIGFQDLYKLKQKLEQMIQAEPQGSGIATKLIELKKHITSDNGQLGYMKDVSDSSVADAAIAADNTFNAAMGRWFETPFMEKYSSFLRERVSRGDNIPVVQAKQLPVGQRNLNAEAPNLADTVMANKTGDLFKQLELAMGADVSKPIMDYYISQATLKMAKALRDNDRVGYVAAQDSFNTIAQQLKNNNSPLYGDLQRAINEIDAVQVELGSKTLAADKLLEQAKRQQDALETSILDKFVDTYNKNKTVDRPDITIGELVTGKNSGGAMEALLADIDRMPVGPQRDLVLQSVKSSAIKQVTARVFGDTPIGLVAPDRAAYNTKLAKLSKISNEELDGTLSGLRILFQDEPFIVEGLEAALRGLGDTNIAGRVKATPAGAGSDTVPNLGIRDAVQGAILITGGYMNPTSAAMRRGSANLVSEMENAAKNVGQDTLGLIISNPREFAKVAEMVALRRPAGEIERAIKNLVSASAYAAKYDVRVQDEDEQTSGAFGSAVSSTAGALSTMINGVLQLQKAF
jgi:hypothetical protein